ncbi:MULTISPECIES: ATP-binding protein [unclassified Microcoleus]|uniref:ATP-binding protein n=1 Tax=unclassified Microcoleus TaxID=2642155 RepID=UPI002FCE8094
MTPSSEDWYKANYRYLLAQIEQVRQILEHHLPAGETPPTPQSPPQQTIPQSPDNTPFRLDELCATFNLGAIERDILLICAGMELMPELRLACATIHGDPQLNYPTFTLAAKVFPSFKWSAISSYSPFHHHQLIEIGSGEPLTLSPLKIDRTLLCYLLGEPCFDDFLSNTIDQINLSQTPAIKLQPSQEKIASDLAKILANRTTGKDNVVQLCGLETAVIYEIVGSACAAVGCNLFKIKANRLPTVSGELKYLTRRWHRFALLFDSVLLLECDPDNPPTGPIADAVQDLVKYIQTRLIVISPERIHTLKNSALTVSVPQLTAIEQLAIWQQNLGPAAEQLNGQVETLVSYFNLNASTIQAACTEALNASKVNSSSPENLDAILWNTCREIARPQLDDLAARVESVATWDDLVIPSEQREMLREMVAQIRQRSQVYYRWGFGGKSARGLGISALFAGMSGTGKTMAAEVVANELNLDMYRIDLSAVVSKYIGETEKNLRRIFDAAENCGAVLLFDEADALFGRRSEVKDSRDRYANQEVSYLLQRMESYQGLAILTTNLKDSLDNAFNRRIRFVVKFPFPDTAERILIWQRVFPKNTPTEGLDFRNLARLNVAGGNICSIALNAAFLAAEAKEPVMMKHILQATQSEYMKLERTLTGSEIGGWV